MYVNLRAIVLVMILMLLMVNFISASSMWQQSYLYKIDPGLFDAVQSNEERDVVVILKNYDYSDLLTIKFSQGVDGVRRALKSHAYNTQSIIGQLISKFGGAVVNSFWIANAMLVRIKAGYLPYIAESPLVERIIPNFEVQISEFVKEENFTVASEVTSWGIKRINAPKVWEMGYNGSGVRICTIDTGVDIEHPALSGKMLTLDPGNPYYPGGWMAFDSSGRPMLMSPQDTHGHGTHVSGTALGGDTENILIGVAPGATLMHALALPYGSGTFAQTLAAMEWAADPYYIDLRTGEKVYTKMPPHVVSMSWGARNYYGVEFLTPVKHMLLLNIIPVAAIGNGGPGTHDNPGNIWGVFAIGATDENDGVASFSGGAIIYWPYIPPEWPFNDTYPSTYVKPDFAAPGVRILSSIPGGGYAAWSGTSMSTPHVAGLIALLYQVTKWDKYQVADVPERLYEVLKSTSLDLGALGQDIRYGWGIIDAYAAVKKALEIAKLSGIKGYVYDNVDESPVQYVDVFAYDEYGKLVAYTQTNASGYYTLPLDPGRYTIVFSRFGYYEKKVEVNVVLYNGTIIGSVRDKVTGEPLANATIHVVEANIFTKTNLQGYYQLIVQPGKYTLRASAEGYFNDSKQVVVGEGEVVVVDFQLYPLSAQAKLFIHVYEYFTELPVIEADVFIQELGLAVKTNSSGIALLEGIPPGVYTIVVSKKYYATRVYSAALLPGEQKLSIDTTFLIGVMSRDSKVFGEDIRQAIVSQGYPSYAVELLDPLQAKAGYKAIVINYFGVDPGADALINFLKAMDQENTSLIFLDSWGAYYHFAGYVLYKYGEVINKYGYPSPAYRSDGYKEGLMIYALDPSSDIFDGLVFDEGYRFYVASLPSDRVDYAAYQSFRQPAVGELSYLGEIVYGGTVYGFSIIVWNKGSEEECWVFMSVGGSYHWAKYMEKGQDMKYSQNMRRLLYNVVKHALRIRSAKDEGLQWMDISVVQFSWPTISAFTELSIVLERRPYGWLVGSITAGDTGRPISGAEISVVGTPVKTFTNETGAFAVWLPEGVFRVRVDACGYYSVDHIVEISVGEVSYLEETLIRKPRAAVMIDFSGQITMFLLSRGWYAHVYRDWSTLYRELGFYDVLVLAGEYIGSPDLWPDREVFERLINATYELGLGIVFLNNYFEYRYLKEYPYGINILYYYYRNPGSIGSDYDKGPVYYVVNKEHPILEGYGVGERVYIIYGGDYDYAWFSKWDGEVLAYIGAETAGIKGCGIGVKTTPYGTRWVLLAGLAPELWTNMDHWSDEAKEILFRSIAWASLRPINISVTPTSVYVGEVLTIEIPPLPGVTYSILIDNIVVLDSIVGRNESMIIKVRVPYLERGLHRVILISEGLFYGERAFYVNTRIDIAEERGVREGGRIRLNITGHPVDSIIMIYIDDNYITSVRPKSVEPLIVELNIPDYFSGVHLINLRTMDGELIAFREVCIEESLFKQKLLEQHNDVLRALQQIAIGIYNLNESMLLSIGNTVEIINNLGKLNASLSLLIAEAVNSLSKNVKESSTHIERALGETSSRAMNEVRSVATEVESNVFSRLSELESSVTRDLTTITLVVYLSVTISALILLIELVPYVKRK